MARILVVDDEVDGTEALCCFLRRSGHEAVRVQSGREALAGLATINPDIVVLDLLMPEMNGIEFLEVLRNYYHGALMPVILLTGLADGPQVRRAVQLGVKRVFVKADFLLTDLLDCINELAVPSPHASPGAGTPASHS